MTIAEPIVRCYVCRNKGMTRPFNLVDEKPLGWSYVFLRPIARMRKAGENEQFPGTVILDSGAVTVQAGFPSASGTGGPLYLSTYLDGILVRHSNKKQTWDKHLAKCRRPPEPARPLAVLVCSDRCGDRALEKERRRRSRS